MKKTLKKMLCGVCSAAMLMGAVSFSASAAHPFTDVKGNQWYANFVDYAYNHGLMAGTGSSTFSPNQTMTRGMLVTVIHAIAGKPAPTTGNHFSDVKANDYFAPAVTWCYENGIVAGTGAKTFSPNQKVTREQMVAIMMKFAKHTGADVSKRADLSQYSDAGKIEGYAVDAFKWAVANGVVSGTSATTLSPKAGAVRAQCAAVLQRYDELLDASQKPEPEKPTEPKPTEPSPTEPEVTEPAPTEPKPTEPAPTEPKPTEPAPTEPEVTEPTHEHKWVHGAYEVACVCTNPECDYMCTESDAKSAGLELTLYYYRNHCEVVENGLTEHSYEEQVVFNPDSLTPDCWVCSECGEKTTVNPSYVVHDWVYERVNAGEQSYDKWTCSKCGVVATVDPTNLPAHPKHEHSWCSGSLTPAFECQDCPWFCTESEAERAGLTLEEFYNQNHRNTADPSLGEHSYKETKVFSMYHPAADHWICDKCGIITSINPIK